MMQRQLSSLVISVALLASAGRASSAGTTFPVPREQAVVVETDTAYTNLNVANPLFPAGNGTQWGSGWHQVANEWDWYINYATGEQILWRTTGWEYSTDHKQLTWHVRRGVTWNDGVPYTARDIVFTFSLWMKDPSLAGAGTASNVASVTAADEYTVVFKLKQADPRFHQAFRMWGGGAIVARHIYEKVDAKTYPNWPPVETGPYKLLNWYPDMGLYVWQADPNYWGTRVMGKKPGPKYVIFRVAPPADLDLREFVQGNVDMPMPITFPLGMVRAAERAWTHTVRSPYVDAACKGIAGFNAARFPVSDREFRWALQYLLNREKLRKLSDVGESTTLTMWPWPDWAALRAWEVPAVKDKYGPMLRYDPAMAAKELDRLGFRKGSEGLRRTPDGKPFALVLVSNAAPNYDYVIASDFSDELRKVGIDNVVKVSGAGITDEQVSRGEYDIGFGGLVVEAAFTDDPFPMINTYAGTWAKPLGEIQTSGDYGMTRLNDPTLDAIGAEMAARSPGDPGYIELVGQALDRWYDDLPSVPAMEQPIMQIMSDKYWTNWPVSGHLYQVPYQWWPSLIFILFEIKPAG